MHVYSVMGGWIDGGYDGCSLRLFDRKTVAEEYAKDIETMLGYDYVTVRVMDVL